MKQLREKVFISTPTGILDGELVSGCDRLPVLELPNGAVFTTASLPDTWLLRQAEPSENILLHTWLAISEMQSEIAAAQRRIEQEIEEGGR